MKTVKLDKIKLLKIVKKNREGHRSEFEKAFDGYRRECESVLQANLESLRTNKGHIVQFQEFPPTDHTGDYDRVLLMLEMSVDDNVELEVREFSRYVQDDWDWKEQWSVSNAKYTNH